MKCFILYVSEKVNCELFELFGTKELILSYMQTDYANEIDETIRSFLLRYCVQHAKDWDDHLPAIAYAFNLIHSVCMRKNGIRRHQNIHTWDPRAC